MNCDDILFTATSITIEELCSAADKEDKSAVSEEVTEESPIPSFGVGCSF